MKVLLVDDHPLILAALQAVIRGLGDDVTVLGVGSEHEARAALEHDPDHDLVLLDLYLGDSDGFAFLAELRGLYPALPIVVVSASDRASDVIRAIDAGAMGFVPKRASNQTLFEALRLVMSGGIYVPPMTLGSGPAAFAPANDGDTVPDVMRPHPIDEVDELTCAPGAAPHQGPPASLETLGLSKRQAAVLAYLLQGLPNKIIAREMHLSVDTVKDHVTAVLRALGVSSRTQAVLAVSQITQRAGGQGQPAWRRSQH
ncbi:MAG: response regulator transcription factor [Burkholderiaceae bacterium]|nr:response regulator transcription factor [Burkholderiaceae bacterium]